MWIFGYGSLIWKVDFPYRQRVVGYIKGYVRRFWQASIDHRGVPGKPGRVVTLVPSDDPEEPVWGVAYEIDEAVAAQLDRREKDGYRRTRVLFHPDQQAEAFDVEFYAASEDNEFYCGPDTMEAMARQIASSIGPSGANSEYLFRLAAALRRLKPDLTAVDAHLFQLEALVAEMAPPLPSLP